MSSLCSVNLFGRWIANSPLLCRDSGSSNCRSGGDVPEPLLRKITSVVSTAPLCTQEKASIPSRVRGGLRHQHWPRVCDTGLQAPGRLWAGFSGSAFRGLQRGADSSPKNCSLEARCWTPATQTVDPPRMLCRVQVIAHADCHLPAPDYLCRQ